ncbi:phosphatase 2C-like domain-containing protein [Dissophora ornata]|nr:phosphatase 2C-like domain-containing protein [Dissophora ornata]
MAPSFFDQPFQNTRHNYVFAHGASGFAKNPGKAPTLTPEEDHAYFSVQVGEDSYFSRHDALGVADGVGGWSGANPALYSRKLMHYAFLELEKYDNIEEDAFYDYFNVNPVNILEKSYEQSARDAKKEGLIGSSTACLAILRDDELRIANLGDCGVSVIRRNEFIFRTEEQQHSFNYPYQLGTGSTDIPTDAQVFTVKVESGDIVVMGTDGIFDNLFDEDILEEVVRCVSGVDPNQNQNPYGTDKPAAILSSKGIEPSVISDALAKRAKSVSEDTRHHGSPFQSRAMQEGLYFQGGKQDDMSVLVAIIKVAEDSPDRR